MKTRLLLGLILALACLTFVSAIPQGPSSITVDSSQTWTPWAAISEPALAGNVTQMDLNGNSVTRTWQGYYGNVTGMIVLGDASNNTLYNWNLAHPQGQIYAIRSSTVPTWTSVRCASTTEIQTEDTAIGANETLNQDSVNNTFVVGGAPDQIARFGSSELNYPTFYVANQTIVNNTCPLAVMYNASAAPSPDYKEVLLSDGVNANIIYTGLIAYDVNPFNESVGFDNKNHDFEMLVGENGHGTDTATSTYWFYLELS